MCLRRAHRHLKLLLAPVQRGTGRRGLADQIYGDPKKRETGPAKPAARLRKKPGRRGDGREPVPFGAAVAGMMTERAWQAPVAGGSLVDQWAELAPELVGKVAPVRFRGETGVLELRPASPAYGTQLRLLGGQLVARINTKLSEGRSGAQAAPLVRAAGDRPPRAGDRGRAGEFGAGGEGGPGAHPGDRVGRLPPGARCAPGRQVRAHRPGDGSGAGRDRAADQVLRQQREAEAQFADGLAAGEELAEQAAAAADPHALALKRAREDKAGCLPAVPRLFGAA